MCINKRLELVGDHDPTVHWVIRSTRGLVSG